MDKIKLANDVLDAFSACAELKAAAQAYLDSPDGKNWEILVAEAKEDISGIDGTIGFFSSDSAKQIFGAELAAQKLAHAKQIKAQGAVYCDCPGCTAAKAIIDAE